MLALIVAMVLGATLSRNPSALTSADSYLDQQQALLAIDIGVNYAKARFRENMLWRGTPDDGPVVTLQTPDGNLTVVEDHGNVCGTVRFQGNHYGQFRIRFNFEDGPKGKDDTRNPTKNFSFPESPLSSNNLTNGSPDNLFSVEDGKPPKELDDFVQPFQAQLAVEGLAGPALRDVDPMAPNKIPDNLRLARKVAQVRLEGNFSDSLDAAAMAAGDFQARLTKGLSDREGREDKKFGWMQVSTNEERSARKPPRIRTKGTLNVESDNSNPEGFNLHASNGFANTIDGAFGSATKPSSSISVQSEEKESGFYSLGWDEVHKSSADPSDSSTVQLQAGTYVVWEKPGPSGPVPELHYYDMGMDEYLQHAVDNPSDKGMVLSNDLNEVRINDKSRPNAVRLQPYDPGDNPNPPANLHSVLMVRDDVLVVPSSNTSDFNFIPSRGFMTGPADSNGKFPGEVNDSKCIPQNIQFQFVQRAKGQENSLTCPGNVNINARVQGQGGSIVSESNIRLIGAGSLSGTQVTDGGDGLSLYAKGDVTLSTFLPLVSSGESRYADFVLKGVVYAWGDIHFDLAPANRNLANQLGYLWVTGAVVAYGGDPSDLANPEPGSGSGGVGSGRGHINIEAQFADLRYDSKYLSALNKLATPSSMEVISYTLEQ